MAKITEKQREARRQNVLKSRDKVMTHGISRWRRLTPNRWPPVLRKAYVQRVSELEAMEHFSERHKGLIRLIARTELIVEVASHYMFAQGLMKRDSTEFLDVAPELRGWTNTLSRLYEKAGLTACARRDIIKSESVAEWLSSVDNAEVEDASTD